MSVPCTITLANDDEKLSITVLEKYDKNCLGGYDFSGELSFVASDIQIQEKTFYFSSQQLDLFLRALKPLCWQKGSARYVPKLDNSLLHLLVRRKDNGSFEVEIKYENRFSFAINFETTLPYIENLIADLQNFWQLYVKEESLSGKKAKILISEPWDLSSTVVGTIISQVDNTTLIFESDKIYQFGEKSGSRFELHTRYEQETIEKPGRYTINGSLIDQNSRSLVFIGSIEIE